MSGPAACLDDVSVTYPSPDGPVQALAGASLSLLPGTSTALLGRSGSGKSTLVSVLCLLRQPSGGRVRLTGIDTTSLTEPELCRLRNQEIGIVFQSFHLEPNLTALENVMLSSCFRTHNRPGRKTDTKRALSVLEQVQIPELARRKPNQMSGGQRQRVAIARALFLKPALFVADEPTGNLDEATAAQITELLFNLPGLFGTAVLVVTHDRQVADYADQIRVLSQGRVLEPDANTQVGFQP